MRKVGTGLTIDAAATYHCRMAEKLYTTADAARKLKMQVRTVQRLCKALELGMRIGRQNTIILTLADIASLRPFKGRKAGGHRRKITNL